jgi:hypothetical protein
MADRPPTSSFSLWLDEALSGWILPVTGLAVVGGFGLLYAAGLVSEEATASLVVVAVGLGVGLYVLRPALDGKRDPRSRVLSAAAAILTAVATVLPALRTVHPGDPVFGGELGQVDDTIAVPGGMTGAVRLLVSGKLAERGEPAVTFTIGGTRDPVEGKLERTFGYARVGRGGRARVAHDHTADFYPAQIPPGARELKLERIQGQLGSQLLVAVYREPIPVAGGPWVLAAVALLLAAVADARLGLKNNLAVAAGMAVAFGLLVTYNATPAAAVGPAVGGVVLGALGGSLGGWLAGAIARRFVPQARKRGVARPNAASAA